MTESRYQRTYPISWDQLHRDAKALSWRLLDKDFFKGIIAVTRGGLVPAAIIARTISFTYFEENSSVSSGDIRPATGSAMTTPSAPAALNAEIYFMMNSADFSARICTISGSS